MLYEGHWNSPGRRAIYAGLTFSGCLLELLVHANLAQPPKHHQVMRIVIPDEIVVEVVSAAGVPNWAAEEPTGSRAFGDAWLAERRTAVLQVPSVLAGGRESNLVLNPDHPSFCQIEAGGAGVLGSASLPCA